MNLKRHHVLYGLLALVLIAGLVFLFYPYSAAVSFIPSSDSTSTAQTVTTTSTEVVSLETSTQSMRFEIVTTDAAQERGLGGRADIPENYGMLFVFPTAKQYGFWMKDMLTPIDMLWLSDNGTIIAIDASVSPTTYPKAFYPPQPVRLVLETRAGEAARKGWKIGAIIQLPPLNLPSKK